MLSKEEKQKIKLQKQRRKRLEKRQKQLGDRIERLAAFFGVLMCVTMVVLDVIDEKKQNSIIKEV